MNHRYFSVVLVACALFAVSVPARAEGVTDPVILQMADGQFYHPATGKMAASRAALIALLQPGSLTETSSTSDVVPAPSLLKNAIQKAQAVLAERIAVDEAALAKPIHVASDEDWRPMTLALWNADTDAIVYADVLKKGTKLKWISEPIPGVSVKTANGVNSEFFVEPGTHQTLVAVRYPLLKEVTIAKKKQFERHDVVYTPYGEDLRKPELVAEGNRVLQKGIDEAFARLDALQVTSRAFPGKLVTQVIDQKILKSLLLIEHADTTTLKHNPTRAIDTFYVTLATNTDHAYGYAKSSAGALGIAQFMPKTYERVVTKNPGAQLEKNFEKGMRDLDNTIKAETILLDSMLSELPKAVRATALEPESLAPEFLAASYNGGASRVSKAIPRWEAQFSGAPVVSLATLRSRHKEMRLKIADLQEQIKESESVTKIQALKKELAAIKVKYADNEDQQDHYSQITLRKETIDYVVKFRRAMGLLEEGTKSAE